MAAQNDWIVANLNNPDFTNEDMQDVLGMNMDNTQLYDKSYYESKKFITEHPAFQDSEGNFSKEKFESFYDSTLERWDQFGENHQLDNFEYAMFDPRAKANSRIKNPNFRFETVMNPDRRTVGIEGWNITGDRKWTPSELAQTQKIWDPETNTYLDETPNDSALFANPLKFVKNLFADPIMLATWDENGEHIDPASGKVVKHRKGEYKLNDEGTYFAEKVNGRSTVGKQVISALDLITVDNSEINKYDFFDSDSLDKSVTGTIMKSAAAVAPLFFTGTIAPVYSGILIARELCKSLPMLYSMTTALFGNENDVELLNTLAAYGQKFTGGTSEYGKTHTFSFEQIGNMMSDVATQWGQQKLIAQAFNKLKGGENALKHAEDLAHAEYSTQYSKLQNAVKQGLEHPEALKRYGGNPEKWQNSLFGQTALNKYLPAAEKEMQRNARLGADAALAYMAIVSNYDVYNTMLEYGTTKKEAALVAWGSTLGMFGVDKYLHLGEMFFDDLEDQNKTLLRKYVKEKSLELTKDFDKAIGRNSEYDASKNFVARVIGRVLDMEDVTQNISKLKHGINIGKAIGKEISNSISNYKTGVAHHTLGAGGKALGEGLEETAEELVTDTTKLLYEWAGQLGFDTTTDDVGAWDNAFDRYMMSFLGGMAGGAMFYGVGKFNEAKQEKEKKGSTKAPIDEIIYLLRNHKKGDIIRELDTLRKKGKLGSTKYGIKTETSNDNQLHYLTVQEGEKSQNDIAYDMIKYGIDQIDGCINEYGANLSEDDLFKQMVLGDERLMWLKSKLKDQSYSTGYYQAFQNALTKVINAKATIESESKRLTDLQKTRLEKSEEEQKADDKEIKETKDIIDSNTKALKEAETELNEFLTGANSMDYARKMIFLSDPIIQSGWTFNTFDQWLYKVHNRTIDNLSTAEKEKFLNEYINYINTSKKLDDDLAWDAFKAMEKDFTPYLTSLEENQDAIKKLNDTFKELNDIREKIHNARNEGILTYDDRLPDESEEDYNHRNDFMNETLTPEERVEAAKKAEERAETIEQYNFEFSHNRDLLIATVKKLSDLTDSMKEIDPTIYRNLKATIRDYTKKQWYRDAVVHSLWNIGESADKTTLNEAYQELMFKLLKDILLPTVELLQNSYASELTTAKLNLNKFNELLKLISANDNEGIIKFVYQNGFHWKGYLDSLIDDARKYTIDDTEKLKEIASKVTPEFLTSLVEKVKRNISNTEKNVATFFDSETKAEIVNHVFEQYKNAISSSNDYLELFDKLQEVLDSVETYDVIDLSAKNNLINFINSIHENLIKSIGQLTGDTEEELKGNLLSLNSLSSTIVDLLKKSMYQLYGESGELETKNLSLIGVYNYKLKLKSIISDFKNKIQDKLLEDIAQNPVIDFFGKLKKKLTARSPIAELAKIAADKYGISENDIDTVLLKVEDLFDGNVDPDEFTMLPQEELTLRYINKVFDLYNIFMYQSSDEPTWLSPFGHAKFWNDFAKKNPDLFEKDFHLPQLESGIAHQFINELLNYQREILYWTNLHDNNTMNKERAFNTAEQKLEECKLQFYKNNIKAFLNSITINNITCGDLLDEISEEDTVLDVETKIANNLYNILSLGISLKTYLKETQLLEKIIGEKAFDKDNTDYIGNQKTAILDDKLKYEDIPSYQKLQFLISALLFNSSKFKQDNKTFLENQKDSENKIAPLSILEEAIHGIKGFVNSNYAKQQISEYFKETHPELVKDYPFLTNTTIVEGVGGAGKTRAVIRRSIENLKSEEIWQSAPSTKALNTLDESIGKGAKKLSYKELMKEIIIDETAYQNEKKNVSDNKQLTSKGNYIESGTLKLKQTDGTIKALVIDEASYYDYFDLQLIDRWARENNINIIASGDRFQLGSSEYGNSLSSLRLFTLFRTPRLNISLREANVHVMNNNATIDKALSTINDAFITNPLNSISDEKVFNDVVKDALSQIKLSYFYDDNIFNGTLLTKEIPDEILNILKGSKSIAYIGDSKVSSLFKKLTDSGIKFDNENNWVFENVKDIQGSEFDYVIYDNNIALEDSEKSNFYGEDAYNLARKINTINTRGKEGVIIIDKDFTDQTELTSERKSTTSKGKTIQNAIDNFIKSALEKISTLNLSGKYHDLSEITAPSTTTEESEKLPVAPNTNPENDSGDENPEALAEYEESLKKELVEETKKVEEEEIERNPDDEVPVLSSNEINSIGYFMPTMGEFYRDDSGKIVKSDPLIGVDGKTRILRDLGAVIDKDDVDLNDKETLNKYVNNLHRLVATLSTAIISPDNYDGTESTFLTYITKSALQEVFNGTCTEKLSDGRNWGIYLEASNKTKNDEAIGLGYKEVTPLSDGRVYKYVLRFKSISKANTEYAITLGLAADPKWIENNSERTEYENFLKSITEQGVQITSDGSYAKLRKMTKTLDDGKIVKLRQHVGTVLVKNDAGEVLDYKRGWGDRGHGKYLVKSPLMIMGKDISKLGIKASNSGKVGMLVSPFDYKPEELYQIYKKEKDMGKNSPCSVRLLMLDNAGLNWDNLNNELYREFYYRTGSSGETYSVINAEANGYRFLVSLWNWRADLTNFDNIYKTEFTDKGISDETVENAIKAKDEIYYKNGKTMPDSLDGFDSILTANKVTKEDVQAVIDFNDKLDQENYHTFRLGGSKHGRVVQTINPKDKNIYFGKATPTEKVYGLAVTPKIAKLYKEYIDGIFDLFTQTSDPRVSLKLQYNDDSNVYEYSLTDRIDGDRLGSLKKNKSSDETRAGGNSFTNFLDDRSNIDSIEITYPGDRGSANRTVNLQFRLSNNAFSSFYYGVSHLYTLAKVAAWNRNEPDFNFYGRLKLKFGKKTDATGKEIADEAVIDDTKFKAFIKKVQKSPEYDIHDEMFRASHDMDSVDTSKWRFEFGDMFDYMLHGTKLDVSANRDDTFRISGAMYPHGIFVDPNATLKYSDPEGSMWFYTDLPERFAVTDCDVDLVFRFKYKKSSTPEQVKTPEPIASPSTKTAPEPVKPETTITTNEDPVNNYYTFATTDPKNFEGKIVITKSDGSIASGVISSSTNTVTIRDKEYNILRTSDPIVIYDRNDYVAIEDETLNKMESGLILDNSEEILPETEKLHMWLNTKVDNANGYNIKLKPETANQYFVSDSTTDEIFGTLFIESNGLSKFEVYGNISSTTSVNDELKQIITEWNENDGKNYDILYEKLFKFYFDEFSDNDNYQDFVNNSDNMINGKIVEYANKIDKIVEDYKCNLNNV